MAQGRPLIGMLRWQGRPGANALALTHAAAMLGADLLWFTPADVDLDRQRILGWRWRPDGTGWQRQDSRFPDVIDNDGRVRDGGPVWKALTARAPATTRRLADKDEIARRMTAGGFYPELQLPTEPALDPAAVLRFGADQGEVVLKPLLGSGGRGLVHLAPAAQGWRIMEGEQEEMLSEQQLVTHLSQRLASRPHVMQRYILSRSPSGLPFDIRLHVRRNGEGDWVVVKIYARIGAGRGIASNIGQGGSIAAPETFLALRHGAEAPAIMARLKDLARRLPADFQALFPRREIDALGFDLGLDPEGRFWLFEVNAFPGAKYFEIEDAVPRAAYALHVLAKARSRRAAKA
ncbi:MAG: YheC/YheD family protein [Gemmobacter sp.]|uniref:YheC/YheD family protein n=1 Tax=Gemmobacter sp. TaxID=1898957 RepID=UPI001A60C33A|nr:YheC/YheD family protein [Gemmobacter sp.]MBL8563558.1 YheC/YheD family protein [Gemmobacter sp.]